MALSVVAGAAKEDWDTLVVHGIHTVNLLGGGRERWEKIGNKAPHNITNECPPTAAETSLELYLCDNFRRLGRGGLKMTWASHVI